VFYPREQLLIPDFRVRKRPAGGKGAESDVWKHPAGVRGAESELGHQFANFLSDELIEFEMRHLEQLN